MSAHTSTFAPPAGWPYFFERHPVLASAVILSRCGWSVRHHAAEVRDMAINVSRAPPNVTTSSGGGYFPPNVTHGIEIDGNEVQCPGASNIGNAFAIILDNRE